jgi:hypothetical protein
VPKHFSHPKFQCAAFEDVPTGTDLFIVDERWLAEWEAAYIDVFEGKDWRNVGYVTRAIVRHVTHDAMEVSWYPNLYDRFHEVRVMVPRDAFVACVDVCDYDEKTHVFVRSEWLNTLYLRPYSAFALVDAIGVKALLQKGALPREKLVTLRERIDAISERSPGLAFVSFADSLLVKINWFVGKFDSEVAYSYEPETLVRLLPEVAAAYRELLGLETYGVITQGANEYADTALIHRSPSGGHVSLNSLGLPFAQLLAIDEAVRRALRAKTHDRYELYVDDTFLHSLRFRLGFSKTALPNAAYTAPMSSVEGRYYCTAIATVLDNLDPDPSPIRWERRGDA